MDVTLSGIITLVNSFLKNVPTPMDLTLFGIVTLFN